MRYLLLLALVLLFGCTKDPVTPEPDTREYWMLHNTCGVYTQRIPELDELAGTKLDKVITNGQTSVWYHYYPFDEYMFLPSGEYEIIGFTGKFKDNAGIPTFGPNGLRPYEYFKVADREVLYYGFAVRGNEALILAVAEPPF